MDLEKSHVGEVGLDHFGFTCTARAKKGEHKVLDNTVKFIPKVKMRASICVFLFALLFIQDYL